MENEKPRIWMKEDDKKVSFQLDDDHKLYVERTDNGFTLRVYDERGREHQPDKPVQLYYGKISDSQLGFLRVPKE
jgi:hypothetical protein